MKFRVKINKVVIEEVVEVEADDIDEAKWKAIKDYTPVSVEDEFGKYVIEAFPWVDESECLLNPEEGNDS